MVGSSASEVLFVSVNHSITLMGKVWLMVLVFLRVLMLLLAGFPLYQDEQERFVCNTIQPGCANMCFDLFSPVSLFRFWLVQLIAVSLPYIIFLVYVVHKVSSGLSVEQPQTVRLLRVQRGSLGSRRGGAQSFTGAYILQLFCRTLLEAGFGAAHYYLFGFYIPRRFLCQHPPCTTQVDCYVSRPTEKTVMLNFMLGLAALSLLLDVLDFLCAVKRSVRQTSRRKTLVETAFEEERCFLSDPNAPAAQRHLQGETGSFRKRHGSKDSSAGGGRGSPGAPGCNTNGNNDYLISQEDAVEKDGSEVALCPPELGGTPRSIRVSKRSRLKPPPPPRRDPGFSSGGSATPAGDASSAGGACTRRGGQYTLVELSGAEQSNEDGLEKRSQWV